MTLRLLQFVDFVGLWRSDGLCFPCWPSYFDAINGRRLPQAEMQSTLILRAESAAARHFLRLLLTVPEQTNLCADGAAIARHAFQLEVDPFVIGRDRVFVKQRRAF